MIQGYKHCLDVEECRNIYKYAKKNLEERNYIVISRVKDLIKETEEDYHNQNWSTLGWCLALIERAEVQQREL